jgi:hypothetical protein
VLTRKKCIHICNDITIHVKSHFASRNIGSYTKIGNPQVFYLPVSENVFDGSIESVACEHGREWIGQVQRLSVVRSHFLRDERTFFKIFFEF